MFELLVFCTCAFALSPHFKKDPSGAKVLEGPEVAKGPEVHVEARGMTDQGGAIKTMNPIRARGINKPSSHSWAFCYFGFFCEYIWLT